MLTVEETGAGRELLVDGLDAGLNFEELSGPRDAVIEFGGSSFGGGLIVASPDNTFEDIIPGVELTVLKSSNENVTVEVDKAQSELVPRCKIFVDAFNSVRANLEKSHRSTRRPDDRHPVRHHRGAPRRIRLEPRSLRAVFRRRDLFRRWVPSASALTTKVSFSSTPKNSKRRLPKIRRRSKSCSRTRRWACRPSLRRPSSNWRARATLCLAARAETLADTIEGNKARIASMDARLARQRERLLAQFFQLETTIASMQDDLTALSSLQVIPPLTGSS